MKQQQRTVVQQMRNPIADIEIDAELDAEINNIIGQFIAIAETNCDGRYLQVTQDGSEGRPLDYQVVSMFSAMLNKCHAQETKHAPQRDTVLRKQWNEVKALATSSNEIDSEVVARIMASKNAFDLECMFISAIQKHASKGYTYLTGKDWTPYVPPKVAQQPKTDSKSLSQAVSDVVASMDAMFA